MPPASEESSEKVTATAPVASLSLPTFWNSKPTLSSSGKSSRRTGSKPQLGRGISAKIAPPPTATDGLALRRRSSENEGRFDLVRFIVSIYSHPRGKTAPDCCGPEIHFAPKRFSLFVDACFLAVRCQNFT